MGLGSLLPGVGRHSAREAHRYEQHYAQPFFTLEAYNKTQKGADPAAQRVDPVAATVFLNSSQARGVTL